MTRRTIGLAVALALVSATARAIPVEIPLPSLLGAYPPERTIPIHLPFTPTVIHGASFRISGVAQTGTLLCYNAETGNWDIEVVWPVEVFAYVHDGAHYPFWSVTGWVEVSGAFSLEEPCGPHPSNATWDFLRDGTGYVTLHAGGANYPAVCGAASPTPTATIADAVLIVDAEFPVPVGTSTWGRIKALYR